MTAIDNAIAIGTGLGKKYMPNISKDQLSGIAGIIGQIGNDIVDFRQLSDTSNLQSYQNQLAGINRSIWNSDFGSADDILQTYAFNNPNNIQYNRRERTVGQDLGQIGKDALSGAAIGTNFMPGIGTAIGAAAGAIWGGAKDLFGHWQDRKQNEAALAAANKADLDYLKGIGYGINTYNTKNTLMQDFEYKDMGGSLNHGTHWQDNVILVDAGGTHESNPFGGVLMGMDDQGTPNLVEEGEVIWNDYVFSNRLKVPKTVREKYNLKKDGGPLTFAEGIKASKQFKTLEELPNDPVTRRTFDAFITDMAMIQEEERAKENIRNMGNRFEGGGKFKHGVYDSNWTWKSLADALSQYTASRGKSKNGKPTFYAIDRNYDFGDYKNIKGLEDAEVSTSFWKKLISDVNNGDKDAVGFLRAIENNAGNTESNYFNEDGSLKKGWEETLNRISRDGVMGVNHLVADINKFVAPENIEEIATKSSNPADITKGIVQNTDLPFRAMLSKYNLQPDETEVDEEPIPKPVNHANPEKENTFDAYGLAPLLSQLASTIGIATAKPDYTPIERYENYALGLPRAYTHPIGNYVRTRPVDINYVGNRINAQGRNTERLIADLSSGNSASARANMVGAIYGNNNNFGDFLTNAYEYNAKNALADATFNRGTDQYNSEDAYKTMAMNADLSKLGLSALMQGSRDRFAVDTAYGQALSSNISTATQNAYDWAKYQRGMKMIDNNPSLLFDHLWNYKGAPKTASKGGLLTVKKKGRK